MQFKAQLCIVFAAGKVLPLAGLVLLKIVCITGDICTLWLFMMEKKELLRGFATAPMGIFGDQIFSSLAASFQIASAVLFITFTASVRLPDFSSLRAVSLA